MGLRIGEIFGILEGLLQALKTALKRAKTASSDGNAKVVDDQILGREVSECSALCVKANEELNVGKVFGREYWSEDGVWTYAVEAKIEGEEPLFADVVSSHPLVREWESKVGLLMDKYGVHKSRWDGEDWEKGRIKDGDA